MASTEVLLAYGGDYQLQPNGDLALVSDQLGTPAATAQRVTFLVLTDPTLENATGQPIGRPDDLFNPTYGSGIRALVGEYPSTETQLALQASLVSALREEPGVALTPTPSATLTVNAPGNVTLRVSAYAKTGDPISLPSIPLTPSGG